ncbi:MAG: Uma2 family endonuclease [Candidatus Kapaibacteriota bacterium]|jgi:Uma2 family endonuclease
MSTSVKRSNDAPIGTVRPPRRTAVRSYPIDYIHYPESDGEPVANNTQHYELISMTKDGLDTLFADRDDVFVAADLFWYPVKGEPKIVVAPDVMVAFDRPPGPRRSYKQWEEDDKPFHVVFEFLSDANTPGEMAKKALFFNRHGVEEYYLYDMEKGILQVFVRYADELLPVETDTNGWTSPRLGVRFEVTWNSERKGQGEPSLALYYPDGTRFLTYLERVAAQAKAEQGRIEAEQGRIEAEQGRIEAEQGRIEAEQERLAALSELAAEREATRILQEKLKAAGIEF